jgi:parallel beta-helix repeat protein
MTVGTSRGTRCAVAVLLVSTLTMLSAAAFARTVVVRPGVDVQAAIDAALPGDRIRFESGLYTRTPSGPHDTSLLTIETDGLVLEGPTDAVIEASGFEYGIRVGPDLEPSVDGCPAQPLLRDFRIDGLTIQNAGDTGLRLAGVEGYTLIGGVYLDNAGYGPFPICSRNGLIADNFASGHANAAIHVADDHEVLVTGNFVTNSAVGIEIENSTDAVIRNNFLTHNTAGILTVVLPGLPIFVTADIRIEQNWIVGNNLANPGGRSPAFLPRGTGVLNVGGDRVIVRHNFIQGNDSVGVALTGNAFGALLGDPRIDPFLDDNQLRENVIVGNGGRPDLARVPAGADILFVPDAIDPDTGEPAVDPATGEPLVDPDPSDNCLAPNAFQTDFPPGVGSLFPCP